VQYSGSLTEEKHAYLFFSLKEEEKKISYAKNPSRPAQRKSVDELV